MFLENRRERGLLRITHACWFDTPRRRMLPAQADHAMKDNQQMVPLQQMGSAHE